MVAVRFLLGSRGEGCEQCGLARIFHPFLLLRPKSFRGCVMFRSAILNVYQHDCGREPHMPCHERT